jgi:hypothetical protein
VVSTSGLEKFGQNLVGKNLVKIWFEKIWLKTHIGSATHWRPGEQMFRTDV